MLLSLRARVLAACLLCAAVAAVPALGALRAGAASPNASEYFAVLGTSPTAGDATLFSTVRDLRERAQGGAASGPAVVSADPSAARTRAASVAGAADRTVSVTTAADSRVCLGTQDAVTDPIFVTCAAITTAGTHGLIEVNHAAPGEGVDPDMADVTALVPDGVDEVRFTLADGTSQRASVTANTVAEHLDAPVAMSFSNAASTTTVDLNGGK
jgi:hypothetical protein